MWDLIVSIPDHCLSFYFGVLRSSKANSCRIFSRPWSSGNNHYFRVVYTSSTRRKSQSKEMNSRETNENMQSNSARANFVKSCHVL